MLIIKVLDSKALYNSRGCSIAEDRRIRVTVATIAATLASRLAVSTSSSYPLTVRHP